MTQLLTGVEHVRSAGTHNFKVVIGTGTAVLQYQVTTEGFDDIPNTTLSASTGLTITLPKCKVKATLTGDAAVYISKVHNK